MGQEDLNTSVKIISPAFLLFLSVWSGFQINHIFIDQKPQDEFIEYFWTVLKFTDTQLCYIIYFLKNETKTKVLPVPEEVRTVKTTKKS